MNLSIYKKRGKPNYKENKLIKALNKVLLEKIEKDPSFKFTPATTPEELFSLHNHYCSEVVDFTEIPDNNTAEKTESNPFMEKPEEKIESPKETPASKSGEVFYDETDPFNRQEMNVRSYVLGEDPMSKSETKAPPANTVFVEPTDFKQAFTIPEDVDAASQSGATSSSNTSSTQNSAQNKQQSKPNPPKQPSVNPAFDDMDTAKKKKQTKMFAKWITEAVCTLAEKGFINYANKDINAGALAELEISGEANLDIMITLDNNQEGTVKDFFSMMCVRAEELAVIDKESRMEIADALGDYLLEKGIAPTSGQSLMMVVAEKFLIGKGLSLLVLKQETNSVLNQIKEMSAHNKAQQVSPSAKVENTVVETPKAEERVDDVNQISTDLVTTK